MITINITSDVPLTDPRFESLLKAAADISESMGETVQILAESKPKLPAAYEIEVAKLQQKL